MNRQRSDSSDDDTFDPVADALAAMIERHRGNHDGALADYIPQLATVDPDGFAAALVSVHGGVHTAGDATREFTIQSVSKPFVYALAVSDLGLPDVSTAVGFEPSGEPFNAISLDPVTGRPSNPLINAGAIVSASLIDGATAAERFERVRSFLSACAGRELEVDEDVFQSESQTGDRNRALAHLARASGVLRQSVSDATEVYFRQCSLRVNATDVAVMASTLANGGVNPVTNDRVMAEPVATVTLSVMATCGMYDRSGEWMARVGLPAKSGVGGGIVAANPAEFGIGVYSPRLDSFGNSVRGTAVLEALSEQFDLHVFDHPDEPRSPIAAWHADEDGLSIELRGQLDLIATEELLQRVASWRATTEHPRAIHLDVTGVTRSRTGARRLLDVLGVEFGARGVTVDIVGSLD